MRPSLPVHPLLFVLFLPSESASDHPIFFCVAVIDADEADFASIEDSSSALDDLQAEEVAFYAGATATASGTLAQRVATGVAGSVQITHNAQPVATAITAAAASAIGNIRWGIVIDAGLFLKFYTMLCVSMRSSRPTFVATESFFLQPFDYHWHPQAHPAAASTSTRGLRAQRTLFRLPPRLLRSRRRVSRQRSTPASRPSRLRARPVRL